MRSVVVLVVVCGFAYGSVDFTEIHKDDQKIPKNLKIAEEDKNWKVVEEDKDLKISWYSRETDPYVQLAFDGRGVFAGIRLAIPKEGEQKFYTESKLFKEEKISDKPFYTATVLFTMERVLTNGGRRTTEEDEIVQLVEVKLKDGLKERILRDACDNAKKNIFLEQGCEAKYGLVFAPFKTKDEKCDYPFFLVYNEERTGDMLGFGWLVPAADIKGTALADSKIEELFPFHPDCLTGKSRVTIWLAKEAKEQETCALHKVPGVKFVEERCQTKRRGGM